MESKLLKDALRYRFLRNLSMMSIENQRPILEIMDGLDNKKVFISESIYDAGIDAGMAAVKALETTK